MSQLSREFTGVSLVSAFPFEVFQECSGIRSLSQEQEGQRITPAILAYFADQRLNAEIVQPSFALGKATGRPLR